MIKECDVAGQFYPKERAQLIEMIENFSSSEREIIYKPKAIIVPHAGFIYSGDIAAKAYKALIPLVDNYKKIILLSPAHRKSVTGVAYHNARKFACPIGDIPVNAELLSILKTNDSVYNDDEAFNFEHGLETHFPFISYIFRDISFLPLIVGNIDTQKLSDIFNLFWQADDILFIISSDLSHFHNYEICKTLDHETTQHIINLNYEKINHDAACGYYPLCGALKLAKDNNQKCYLLSLKNSGDSIGDKDSVVGYGSFIIS